jgi:hypothetical protein
MKPLAFLVPKLGPFALAAAALAQTAPPPAADPHAILDRLLAAYVHGERVDYLTLRDRDYDQLALYLDQLAAVASKSLGRTDQLAFYLNLYNATAIRAVIDRLVAGYSVAANEWALFDEPLVRLDGGKVSLNHLEHEIIRKRFDDPRIHAALVCAARSAPALAATAYRGATLEDVLEQSMRRFINDPARNVIAEGELRLSKLFEWYADDFGGKPAVTAYVQKYVDRPVGGLPVQFLDYSWDLNLAAPEGDWVQVDKATENLERGALCQVLATEEGRVKVRRPRGGGEVWLPDDAVDEWTAR